jgi:hypothetical protein
MTGKPTAYQQLLFDRNGTPGNFRDRKIIDHCKALVLEQKLAESKAARVADPDGAEVDP